MNGRRRGLNFFRGSQAIWILIVLSLGLRAHSAVAHAMGAPDLPRRISSQSPPQTDVALPLSAGRVYSTPLELSGLTPLWAENFSDGSIDRMQFTWAKGFNDALRSYVMPGAVYLGKEGATDYPWVEQEINNFKAYAGEPLPNTLEFDVLSPFNGSGRVSLRPRRLGDFANLRLGLPGDKTSINFRFISGEPGTVVDYAVETGPSFGWAHVTVSYEQYVLEGVVYAHYVAAINEEVHEFSGPSGLTNPDWLTYWTSTFGADGWSIEHSSPESLMGKYIGNVRAYHGFLTLPEMAARLQGRVSNYLTGLPDPRAYTGPTKAFQVHKLLELYGPNALAYAEQTGAPTVKFDGSLSSSWGKITAYDWTFGDGDTGNGRIVNHTYSQPGSYQAELTVSNKYGTESHAVTVTISVLSGLALSSGQFAEASPGSQIVFTHILTNTGNITDSYDLTAEADALGWLAVVAPAEIGPLAPNQSATFTVTAYVSPQALGNSQGVVTLTATSQADNMTQGSVTSTITVKAVHGLSLAPPTSALAVPGSAVTLSHTLTNTGNVVDSFTLSATVDLPGWPAIAPAFIGSLAPGASAVFSVTLQVPAHALAAEVATVTVTATSQGDNAVQAMLHDQVTVAQGETPSHRIYLPLIRRN